MDTYVILRRSGWRSPEDLEEAGARSAKVGDEEMSDRIRWIRSYALEEDGGTAWEQSASTRPRAGRRSASMRHSLTCQSTRSFRSPTR